MTTDLRLWERNSRSKVAQFKIIHVNEITYRGKWGKIMHVRTLAGSRYADRNPMTNEYRRRREREREREIRLFSLTKRFFRTKSSDLILNA